MNERESEDRKWSVWMTDAQAGNQVAYEALLRELAPAIRGYLIARFGRYDLIDDCVQECLLAIHQGRHSYNPNFPFKPWLYAVVRNKTIDMLRKTPTGESTLDPEHHEHVEDLSRAIDGSRLLSELSGNLREVLLLTKFVGLSTRECARHLDISESLVKVRIFRGIRKLQAVWNSEP